MHQILHIQTLRAFAVGLVVASHFQIEGFAGGFVGVDIFFVISGFIITNLLLREAESNKGIISLRGFYLRRASRILPLATVTILSTLIVFKIMQPDAEFQGMLLDSAFALFSALNLRLAATGSDYFGTAEAQTPFEHFWSLSVEEQFYLVAPILLMSLAIKFRGSQRKPIALAVSTLLAISFLTFWVYGQINPIASYYSLISRFWEIAAGSLLAILSIRSKEGRHSNFLWGVGMLLVASAALLTSFNNQLGITVAVLAAVLLIYSGFGLTGIFSNIFRWGLLVKIGNLSFGLYLWHWPIYVLLSHQFYEIFGAWATGTMFALTLTLSIVTYFLIEKPLIIAGKRVSSRIENRPVSKPRFIFAIAVLSFLTFSPVAYVEARGNEVVYELTNKDSPSAGNVPGQNEGAAMAGQWPDVSSRIAQVRVAIQNPPTNLSGDQRKSLQENLSGVSYREMPQGWVCNENSMCTVGEDTAKERYLVIGDSHAMMWRPAFSRIVGLDSNIQFTTYMKTTCPNAKDLDRFRKATPGWRSNAECHDFHNQAMGAAAEKNWDAIILIDWESNVTSLETYVEEASKFAQELPGSVVIIGDPPLFTGLKGCISGNFTRALACSRGEYENKVDQRTASKTPRAKYLSVWDLFCDNSSCPIFIGDVASSYLHLNAEAATDVAPFFWAKLQNVLLKE